MRKSLLIIGILSVMSFFVACEKESPEIKALREETLAQDGFGVKTIFLYNQDLHQLAFNNTLMRSRIQTDDQERILQMTLKTPPVVGEENLLTLYTKGVYGLEDSYEVKVLEVDEKNNTVRMMSEMSLIGFVMYYEF